MMTAYETEVRAILGMPDAPIADVLARVHRLIAANRARYAKTTNVYRKETLRITHLRLAQILTRLASTSLLALPARAVPRAYNVYRQWGTRFHRSVDTAREAWAALDDLRFGEGYEVRDERGICHREFVPF